jgi:hypothetical protein
MSYGRYVTEDIFLNLTKNGDCPKVVGIREEDTNDTSNVAPSQELTRDTALAKLGDNSIVEQNFKDDFSNKALRTDKQGNLLQSRPLLSTISQRHVVNYCRTSPRWRSCLDGIPPAHTLVPLSRSLAAVAFMLHMDTKRWRYRDSYTISSPVEICTSMP